MLSGTCLCCIILVDGVGVDEEGVQADKNNIRQGNNWIRKKSIRSRRKNQETSLSIHFLVMYYIPVDGCTFKICGHFVDCKRSQWSIIVSLQVAVIGLFHLI